MPKPPEFASVTDAVFLAFLEECDGKAVLRCRLQMFNGNLTSEYVGQNQSTYTVHSAGQLGGMTLAGINAPGSLSVRSKAAVAYSEIHIAMALLAIAAFSVSFRRVWSAVAHLIAVQPCCLQMWENVIQL